MKVLVTDYQCVIIAKFMANWKINMQLKYELSQPISSSPHAVVPHACTSVASPPHALPPCWAVFSTYLDRICEPPPQDAEHMLHSLHPSAFHEQLTVIRYYRIGNTSTYVHMQYLDKDQHYTSVHLRTLQCNCCHHAWPFGQNILIVVSCRLRTSRSKIPRLAILPTCNGLKKP